MRTKRAKTHGTRRAYTYRELLTLLPCCAEAQQQRLQQQLRLAPKPAFVGDAEVPENLNAISYGTLDDLRAAASADDPVAACLRILLGMDEAAVYEANCVEVFGFVNFVREELERINGLFAKVRVNYSQEEVSAGVHELDFGSFGVMDWYARRMGITNQNDVRQVAWVRIYACMKNDTALCNFERRLQKQYIKK